MDIEISVFPGDLQPDSDVTQDIDLDLAEGIQIPACCKHWVKYKKQDLKIFPPPF